MTERRRRMIEALQLRGLAERPHERYVRAVRPLAPHVNNSPDQLTEAELRQSFLHLKNVRKYSRRATTMALCGLKVFVEHTRKRAWTTLTFVRPSRERKLPVILSLKAGREIFRHVRWLPDRPCLTTIDACGWRLQEGTPLRVTALDRARRRMHGRHGKGGQDRYVPRPQRRLELRRHCGVTHRNALRMFPAPGRGRIPAPTATKPMPQSRLQEAFREALKASGVTNLAGVPTRRHAWATHLLDAGVNRRLMQASRGHNSPTTPAV